MFVTLQRGESYMFVMPPRDESDGFSHQSLGESAANPSLSPRGGMVNISLSPMSITNTLLSPREGAFNPSLSPCECINMVKATSWEVHFQVLSPPGVYFHMHFAIVRCPFAARFVLSPYDFLCFHGGDIVLSV